MIYSQPGATFAAVTSAFATGLTGTLGVRIENTDGTTHTNRVTAGIVEIEAASGIYTKANLVAPATAGVYVLLWDNGAGLFDSERLEVTSTSPAAASPSGTDLTTLAAVRSMLQKGVADTGQDAEIQRAITRASAAIRSYTGREFTPTTAEARTFDYPGGGILYLGSNDLRAASLVEVTVAGGTPAAVATDQYDLRPLPARDGVYTEVHLPYNASLLARQTVTITGDWGFAAVPADVEEACALTVSERIRRDVSGFSQVFADDEAASPVRPISLPKAARDVLDNYRRPLVA